MRVKRFLLVAVLVVYSASAARALPLITSIAEHGTGLDVQGVLVSSATDPSPSSSAACTSAGLDCQSFGFGNEAFWFNDRTHEATNARVDANGALTTSATGTLVAFPNYLAGLEYIQISNDNRAIADYSLDVTIGGTKTVTAYLFLDNRNNGVTGALDSPNTTDPNLGTTGPLSWVLNEGWQRLNTGIMPKGRPDYLGSDEGATVATVDLRTHSGAGNVAGPGEGLNQFFSIYYKKFAPGSYVGFTKQNGIPGGTMYTVAVGPPPGDTNGDYAVDNTDYLAIKNNFMGGPFKTLAEGDINGDGFVDFSDFRAWKTFRTTSGAALGNDFSAVPEPLSMVLLLAGGTLACVARRR